MSDPAHELRRTPASPSLTRAPTPMAATVGTLPAERDLNIFQGDTFTMRVTVLEGDEPANLDGFVAAAQIRVTPPTEAVLADFDASLAGNVILLELTSEQTAELRARGGAWDVQVTSAEGRVTTLLRGRVRVTEQVTRP